MNFLSDAVICLSKHSDHAYVYHRIYGMGIMLPKACINSPESMEKEKDDIIHKELEKRKLIESDEDLSDFSWDTNIENMKPNILELIVTKDCNCKCEYCYQTRENTYMKVNDAVKYIHDFIALCEQSNLKTAYMRFIGGEPFLAWDVIKTSVEEAVKIKSNGMNIIFCLNTNGLFMDKEKAEFLAKYHFEIDLSIDGPAASHNKYRRTRNNAETFDKVCKAAELLTNAGNKFEMSATLTDANWDVLEDVVNLAVALNAEEISVNPLLATYKGESVNTAVVAKKLVGMLKYAKKCGMGIKGKWYDMFLRTKKNIPSFCGRMGKQLSIYPDGYIRPCSAMSCKIGKADNLLEVYENEAFKQIINRVAGKLNECHGCPVEGMCAGGCPATSERLYGEPMRADKVDCEFRRAIVQELINAMLEDETLFDGKFSVSWYDEMTPEHNGENNVFML